MDLPRCPGVVPQLREGRGVMMQDVALVPLDSVLEKASDTEHLLMLKLSRSHQRAQGAQ